MCMCACWLVFSSIIGIIFYVLDVGSDIANGAMYLKRGHKHWGIATLIFVFLPVVIYMILLFIYNVIECCSEQRMEADDDEARPKRYSTAQRLLKIPYWRSALQWLQPKSRSCRKRCCGYIIVFCRLEPIRSYGQVIRHGLRGTDETIYEIQKKKQFQIFLETCLESLPQISLQIYILGRKSTISGFQVLSLLISILSAWFIFTYVQIEDKRRQTKTKLWVIKMLWIIFGGIPTLVGAFSAISFFAAVYEPIYLLLYLIVIASITIKWMFITTLKKYNKISIRTLIFIVLSLIKVGLALMITLWYVSVKTFQEPAIRSVVIPKLIPRFIWPETHPLLLKMARTKSSFDYTPDWAKCNRFDMFRNGTFVIDTKEWLSRGGITEHVVSFLWQDKLICVSDIANYIYCTVFYSIVIWFIWDLLFYSIRCCVPSDEEESANPPQFELQNLM